MILILVFRRLDTRTPVGKVVLKYRYALVVPINKELPVLLAIM
jgi:hypothetical protein